MEFDVFANEFATLGGRLACGIPGGGPSLQLVDSMERAGVRFITTGHETTGALMAAAAARQTGVPSLSLSIKGPGFANMAPGLLSNAYEGFPHLSVAEAYPAAAGARRHKWLNHRRLGGEFLRGIRAFDGRAGFATDCWNSACAEFPGPVHVDLVGEPTPVETPVETGKADSPGVALEKIGKAERPVLIVGSAALRLSPALRSQIAGLKIPVFTTPSAKGAIAESSPFAAGIYTGDGKAATIEKQILPKADLVVTLGVRSGEVLNPALPHANVLVLEPASARAGRIFPEDCFGEPKQWLADDSLAAVLDALAERQWGADDIAADLNEIDRAMHEWTWTPWRAMKAAQRIGPDCIHAVDTGNFTVMAEHVLRLNDSRDWVATPNGRFMGTGVGYALGTAAVSDRPVVLWIGDGGLRAFIGELALAAEQGWNLLVLVMKDGHFGSIRGRARTMKWTEQPLRLADRRVAHVGEAMGLRGEVVTGESEFETSFESWHQAKGPALFEVNFPPDDYMEATALLR